MLGFGGMESTPSLPLLPGPLWPGMVAPDKGPIYGLNRTKQHTYAKLNRDRHQHATSKGMDSYQNAIGHMEVRSDR